MSMKRFHRLIRAVACLALLLASQAGVVSAAGELDRTVLPVPEPQRKPITELDARKATPRRGSKSRRRPTRRTSWWC